jgi:tripartite-type tricarboxylate transporter receptor subunit TctC
MERAMKMIHVAFLVFASLLAAPAAAETYPTRAIKLLVPIPPGGAPDVAARLIGRYLSEALGQPVVIENRTGANGNIAADAVAKSDPDGYTLLLGADSGIVINPHVYSKLPFDPLRDLVPVASVANLLHVPYRGGAPAATATIAGETQVFFAGAASSGQFEAGRLRPLAMSGKKRSLRFPELPTIGEFYPGYEIDIWLGLFAPAGTPEPVVARLRMELHKILAQADFAEKLNVSGSLEPLILSPADFSSLIRRDDEKYGRMVKDMGISLD